MKNQKKNKIKKRKSLFDFQTFPFCYKIKESESDQKGLILMAARNRVDRRIHHKHCK